MFTFSVFEILLFEDRLVLSLAQWSTGIERVKVLVKTQKNIWILLKLLETWLSYRFKRFWMVFIFFVLFNPCRTGKLKNSIFEMPIIPQTSLSNSNYLTSAKKCQRESCIMHFTSAKMEFALAIFKKLYFSKYSIKRCCKQITSIQKLGWPYQ